MEPTRTIVLTATTTNLRIGEILAPRWDRINFGAETMMIAETCYMRRFAKNPHKGARNSAAACRRGGVEGSLLSLGNSLPEALVFATRHGDPSVSNNLGTMEIFAPELTSRNGVVLRDTFHGASPETKLILDDSSKTIRSFPWMTAESRGVPPDRQGRESNHKRGKYKIDVRL